MGISLTSLKTTFIQSLEVLKSKTPIHACEITVIDAVPWACIFLKFFFFFLTFQTWANIFYLPLVALYPSLPPVLFPCIAHRSSPISYLLTTKISSPLFLYLSTSAALLSYSPPTNLYPHLNIQTNGSAGPDQRSPLKWACLSSGEGEELDRRQHHPSPDSWESNQNCCNSEAPARAQELPRGCGPESSTPGNQPGRGGTEDRLNQLHQPKGVLKEHTELQGRSGIAVRETRPGSNSKRQWPGLTWIAKSTSSYALDGQGDSLSLLQDTDSQSSLQGLLLTEVSQRWGGTGITEVSVSSSCGPREAIGER